MFDARVPGERSQSGAEQEQAGTDNYFLNITRELGTARLAGHSLSGVSWMVAGE